MIRYTTPTITFDLPFEASYLTAAYITMQQGSIVVNKTLNDCKTSDGTLSVTLSQEETASFVANTSPVKAQLRCIGNDGKAYASRQFKLNVEDVLKEGVLE